jgi:hypothetical protein
MGSGPKLNFLKNLIFFLTRPGRPRRILNRATLSLITTTSGPDLSCARVISRREAG